ARERLHAVAETIGIKSPGGISAASRTQQEPRCNPAERCSLRRQARTLIRTLERCPHRQRTSVYQVFPGPSPSKSFCPLPLRVLLVKLATARDRPHAAEPPVRQTGGQP